MIIYPAIDLSGGKVVRLSQGDFERMDVYGDDPVETARAFAAAGAEFLHVVDLDAAKTGAPVNADVIRALCRVEGLSVQTGGGLRSPERVRAAFDLGVRRAILGTAALRDPEFLRAMLALYGDRIAVGVDARDGKVAVSGWLDVSDTDAMAFCETMRDIGVKTVIYTDISRDGALGGVNLDAYRALSKLSGLSVIASGGVGGEADIVALTQIGVHGAIIGKALYERRIDLSRAIAIAKEEA